VNRVILSTKAQVTRERLPILSHEWLMMRYVLHVFGDRQDELRSNNTSSRPLISCAFSPLSLSVLYGAITFNVCRLLISWEQKNAFQKAH